mmetsp:Transcript_63552/g.207251  ORF Transcript_63552/g.207251 Transcript_63552/m.207251 type:complete len:178 (-) Transcript_63552:341-874(-)
MVTLSEPRSVRLLFLLLSAFEFVQSVRHVVSPETLLSSEEAAKFFPGTLVKSLDSESMRRVFAVVYATYLATLGSVRVAFALAPPSWPLWSATLVAHIVESGFWWALELEDGAVEASTRSSPDCRKRARKLQLFLLAPPSKKVLLAGPPVLVAVLLMSLPRYLRGAPLFGKVGVGSQ